MTTNRAPRGQRLVTHAPFGYWLHRCPAACQAGRPLSDFRGDEHGLSQIENLDPKSGCADLG